MSVTAATGLQEQRRLVRAVRAELLRDRRGRPAPATEPPMRVMARIVRDLERECAARRLDPAAVRAEIVDRTIGDVDLRRVTECVGEPGGPGDYRRLADELGLALPGEDLHGVTATGETYHWLRRRMFDEERDLLGSGVDLRVYDIAGVGNPVLRGRLAEDMRAWGLDVTAEHVALGIGATDCIDKVLRGLARLARRHDQPPGALLVPAPGFTMPDEQALSHGYRLHRVGTGERERFKLTAGRLDEELTASPDVRVVYLTVTTNPTAFAYSPDELAGLRDVVRRHAASGRRVHLLADLAYVGTGVPADDAARMRSLTAGPRDDVVIYVSSWSKTHTLTGERFGWVTFGDAGFAAEMGGSWISSMSSLPAEWQLRFLAYHRLFHENPRLTARIRELYRLRRDRLRHQLHHLDQVHGLFEEIYLDDDATIYNWSRLRDGEDCFSVFEKTGVAGIPGSTFGYSDRYVRFSVGILPVVME